MICSKYQSSSITQISKIHYKNRTRANWLENMGFGSNLEIYFNHIFQNFQSMIQEDFIQFYNPNSVSYIYTNNSDHKGTNSATNGVLNRIRKVKKILRFNFKLQDNSR